MDKERKWFFLLFVTDQLCFLCVKQPAMTGYISLQFVVSPVWGWTSADSIHFPFVKKFIYCFGDQVSSKGQINILEIEAPVEVLQGGLGTLESNWLFCKTVTEIQIAMLARVEPMEWAIRLVLLQLLKKKKKRAGPCNLYSANISLWNSSVNITRCSSLQLLVICRLSINMLYARSRSYVKHGENKRIKLQIWRPLFLSCTYQSWFLEGSVISAFSPPMQGR